MIVAGLNHELHDVIKTKHKYTYRDYKTDADGNVTSEKLVYFKKSGEDRLLYAQAVSEPLKDDTLSVYGHGNTHFFNGMHYENDVDALLMNDSVIYQNFVTNGGNLTINLKSCYAGDTRDGYTMGEALSKYRNGIIIHAPVSLWKYDGTIHQNLGYNQFINGVKVGWDLKR